MSDGEYWGITIALFWVLPAIVGSWIGKSKGRYGAGLLLGVTISWLGVLIAGLLRGEGRSADASSRSNVGVVLGVLGIAGAVVWGFFSYSATEKVDVEATVGGLVGDSVSCATRGFMLLQGRNAEVFGCQTRFSSPPQAVGCFAVVDDVVYDVTNEIRLAGNSLGCATEAP